MRYLNADWSAQPIHSLIVEIEERPDIWYDFEPYSLPEGVDPTQVIGTDPTPGGHQVPRPQSEMALEPIQFNDEGSDP